MERDFLGAMAKEPREWSQEDSVLLGGSVAQWSLSTNIPALLPSMPSNTARKYKQKRVRVGQVSSSSSQPTRTVKGFRSKQKSSPFLDFFRLERQRSGWDFNPSQVTNTCACSMHSQFLSEGCCANCRKPPATNSEQQQSLGGRIAVSAAAAAAVAVDPTDEAFFPLKLLKSQESTSELTLFYGGAVIVYEHVSFDKVQEIMLLARSRPSTTSSFTDSQSKMPVLEPINNSDAMGGSMTRGKSQSQSQSQSQGQGVSNCSAKSSGSVDDTLMPKHAETSTVPLRSVDMASSVSVIPRAIPQARKASLARFLEKRKARMINYMPYCYDQISLHATDGIGDANSNECLLQPLLFSAI